MEQGEYDLVSVSALLPCGHLGVGQGKYRKSVSEFDERGSCESCGTDNEVVYRVRREYLSSEPGGANTVLPDVERWCFACCTHYPHQLSD